MNVIIPILFCIVAFGIMAAALHFSKYKKRKSGCCGGGDICTTPDPKTCEENDTKACVCDPPAG